MTALNKVACPIVVTGGGAGVATFYTDAATDITVPLNAFWTSMMAKMPDDFVITVPPDGAQIEDTTGALIGSWSGGTGGTHTGSTTGSYTGGAGASIKWSTTTFIAGRRIAGRTFLVPLDGAVYDTTGKINPTQRSTMLNYASTFLSLCLGHLYVWHRPHGGVAGSSVPITGCSINLTVAGLKSRKV